MPRYTNEQLHRARDTDLAAFLRARGEIVVRSGSEWRWVYRDGIGEHDSVTVRGGEWFDQKREVGGDAIGFLQEFMDMDFREAMAMLLKDESPGRRYGRSSSIVPSSDMQNDKATTEFVIPERASNMRHLYAYLTKTRHLAPDVITHFVRAGLLYESAQYHNAVFLGLDETGAPRAASLKGTLTGSGFRQTLTGSDTRYGFHHWGESNRLYVFEAPVDMLSFITMLQQDWTVHSYLALDGLSSKALHHFLSWNPQISEILLCLDHDAAGLEAADKFQDELTTNDYANVTRLLPQCKDWNEDIKARLGLPVIPAQKHPKIETYQATVDMLRDLDADTYAEFARQRSITDSLNKIRRELEQLPEDPRHWEPRLLQTVMLCAITVRNLWDEAEILPGLVHNYKPYTDKGHIKTRNIDIAECFSDLCRNKTHFVNRFTALADACLRTHVYIQTDYEADLARQQAFRLSRIQAEPDITMT